MMRPMAKPQRHRTLGRQTLATLVALVLAASGTAAQAQESDETPPDARLEGFTRPAGAKGGLVLPASSNATTWLLSVILGGACLGVMCKNGKRSHLD
jgi:hypothetical protein